MVDDGIDNGSTVLEPLEGDDQLRRNVAVVTGSVHRVGDEEREVEHHEDGEQDAEDAHRALTVVGALQRGVGPATVRRTGCRFADPRVGRRRGATPWSAGAVAIDAQLIDGHTSLFAKLASQRVNGHRVHDRHDQQRKVERNDGGRDDEGLRLRTTSLHIKPTSAHLM